ncbi:MAG: Mut7-C RNAse domain-containing protein [Halobacteriaceae archaeon]
MSDTEPGETGLLCDAMLGSLSRLLRMCGYDTAYVGDRGLEEDGDIAAVARDEDRVLLTRDRALAARVEPSVCLAAHEVDAQLAALAARGFVLELDSPSRCGRCNGVLDEVSLDRQTPPYVPDGEMPRWQCTECGQFFWRGSHWDDVAARLERL